MNIMRVKGKIESKHGFYIGDICYVLSDKVYDDLWGEKHGYKDGIYNDPETGVSFAVAETAYGDGTYSDNEGREYDVDSGTIGLVPEELIDKESTNGFYFPGEGTASFKANNGNFTITLPEGKTIFIDTRYMDDEDLVSDEEYEEEDF